MIDPLIQQKYENLAVMLANRVKKRYKRITHTDYKVRSRNQHFDIAAEALMRSRYITK
jgi:hypothetical protein